MAEKIPYLITCRRCGQQNIQFSSRGDDVRSYCSNACRSAVHNNAGDYPVVKPKPLSMDEYVQIAFTVKVISATTPKPKPVTPPQPKFVRKPKKDILDFRCPTKFKRMYPTQQAAWDFIREVHPDDETIRPYTCTCGAIHIGHSGKPAK